LQPSLSCYEQVATLMDETMNDGLTEKSDLSADIKMYITYVRSLPDGSGWLLFQLFHFEAVVEKLR